MIRSEMTLCGWQDFKLHNLTDKTFSWEKTSEKMKLHEMDR